MIRWSGIALALCLSATAQEPQSRAESAHSFGEVYWVPTYDQALEMARATGRPLFLMGYSLVGDGSTYTAASDDACKAVF